MAEDPKKPYPPTLIVTGADTLEQWKKCQRHG